MLPTNTLDTMAIDLVAPATSSFSHHDHLSTRRINSSSLHHDSHTMLKKLKSHLGSKHHKRDDTVSRDMETTHPQSYSAPATRRPGPSIMHFFESTSLINSQAVTTPSPTQAQPRRHIHPRLIPLQRCKCLPPPRHSPPPPATLSVLMIPTPS